jgi:hypothetical protein
MRYVSQTTSRTASVLSRETQYPIGEMSKPRTKARRKPQLLNSGVKLLINLLQNKSSVSSLSITQSSNFATPKTFVSGDPEQQCLPKSDKVCDAILWLQCHPSISLTTSDQTGSMPGVTTTTYRMPLITFDLAHAMGISR